MTDHNRKYKEIADSRRDIFAFGYDGARSNRRRNSYAFSRSMPLDEDKHVGPYDRTRLRLECRDLRRNDAIVSGVCERFADNVVGTGITPQAKTLDPDWNNEAEAFWSEWEKVCDYRRRVNMRQIQRMLVDSRLVEGGLGTIFTDSGQLQLVEVERIVSPYGSTDDRLVDGIKINAAGAKVAYYVGPRDRQTGQVDCRKTKAISADNFCHASNVFRPDQLHGIPALAPVINMLRDSGELHEAILNRAKLDAFKAWARTSERGAGHIANLGDRNATPNREAGGARQPFEHHAWGMEYYLDPGDKLESLASRTPNNTIQPYSELILRQIGAALSLPYEFLLMDFRQGSFSASRAALMQTYATFANWQAWVVDQSMQRIWNWRIAKAIREGDLRPAPLDPVRGYSQWFKVEWSFPAQDWIDPKAESVGRLNDWKLGADTLTAMAKKKGRDAEEILKEKANEIRIAMDLAAELGDGVGWKDLINAGVPGEKTSAEAEAALNKDDE